MPAAPDILEDHEELPAWMAGAAQEWMAGERAAVAAHGDAAEAERAVLGRTAHPLRERWTLHPTLEDWVQELPDHDDPAVSRARLALLDRIARRRTSTMPHPVRDAALRALLRACSPPAHARIEDRPHPDGMVTAVTDLQVLTKLHPTNGPNDSHAPLPPGVLAA